MLLLVFLLLLSLPHLPSKRPPGVGRPLRPEDFQVLLQIAASAALGLPWAPGGKPQETPPGGGVGWFSGLGFAHAAGDPNFRRATATPEPHWQWGSYRERGHNDPTVPGALPLTLAGRPARQAAGRGCARRRRRLEPGRGRSMSLWAGLCSLIHIFVGTSLWAHLCSISRGRSISLRAGRSSRIIYIYIYIYICMCVYIYIYIYMYISLWAGRSSRAASSNKQQ